MRGGLAILIAGVALTLGACATSGSRPISSTGQMTGSSPAAIYSKHLIVDSATAMLGQPYRYGGAAPGGFDCSGLVVYAAGSAGIHMPRTALEQLHTGVPIAREELRAGDLVFMHLSRKQLHVGIAIDKNRFVHAPAAGRNVRIDSLGAPPYARGFLAARRIDVPPVAPAAPGSLH